MSASERIRARLLASGVSFRANESIATALLPGDVDDLERELQAKIAEVLDILLIDRENDHNTRDTPRRVAKMYLREVFAGRYEQMPAVTDFPNINQLDELYTVGPIEMRSACSHHLCPIEGKVWCGIVPNGRLIGLSKFSRLARWITSRPQIQEEAIVQLADLLDGLIEPKGLAVVMRARHSCMTWRGVREASTTMTTAVVRGVMRDRPEARDEFYRIIAAQGFTCD